MLFILGEPRGNPDKPLPANVTKNALPRIVDQVNAEQNGLLSIPTVSALPPIPAIGEAGFGDWPSHATPDIDGAIPLYGQP